MNNELKKILEVRVRSEITYRTGEIRDGVPVDFMKRIGPEEKNFNDKLVSNLLLDEILKFEEIEEALEFLNEINPRGR